MAAVNDITARDEQLQSYLSQNKLNMNMQDYDSNSSNRLSESHERISIRYSKSNQIAPAAINVSTAISSSSKVCRSENTRTSCTSPDEYVDINEMEFIEPRNADGRGQEENMLMRRSQRKMINKKDDECRKINHFSYTKKKTL